jgi:hypothetical protein
MGIDSNDAKYRRTIGIIVENCGAEARKLLSTDMRFTEEKVRELSGTSPEYQRHVIGRAMAGDTNPFRMIAATLGVYDTVRFGEVTSRLHRALGSVRKEALLLARAVERDVEPNRLADRLLTLDVIADQASRLRDLLTDVETVGESACKLARGHSSKKPPSERLHAASGLGLLAKNVRNVAVLQAAHLPRPDQKEVALRLTADIYKFAVTARDTTRRAFGRLDDAYRVRPVQTPANRVITHSDVDGDAIASAWLAERFLLAGNSIEVLFVPRGRVWGAYRTGDYLVDVGNAFDAKNFFFDHKPPACANRHDSCAARLIWDHLVKLGKPVRHLKPLVDVVFAGDSSRERPWFAYEYAESKRVGFHKTLADAKLKQKTDADMYRTMRRWLEKHHRQAVS